MRTAIAQAVMMYGIAFLLSMGVAALITVLFRVLRRFGS